MAVSVLARACRERHHAPIRVSAPPSASLAAPSAAPPAWTSSRTCPKRGATPEMRGSLPFGSIEGGCHHKLPCRLRFANRRVLAHADIGDWDPAGSLTIRNSKPPTGRVGHIDRCIERLVEPSEKPGMSPRGMTCVLTVAAPLLQKSLLVSAQVLHKGTVFSHACPRNGIQRHRRPHQAGHRVRQCDAAESGNCRSGP